MATAVTLVVLAAPTLAQQAPLSEAQRVALLTGPGSINATTR